MKKGWKYVAKQENGVDVKNANEKGKAWEQGATETEKTRSRV